MTDYALSPTPLPHPSPARGRGELYCVLSRARGVNG